jgi:CRISPR type I-D-associated protein Csc3/Cas10d
MTAIGLAWLTSSRALLTNTPIPATEFDDFADMVEFDFLPGAVQQHTDDRVTVSYLRDLQRVPEEKHIRSNLREGEGSATPADDVDGSGRQTEAVSESPEEGSTREGVGSESNSPDRRRQRDGVIDVRLQTDLEVKLYKLASILEITRQQHGSEIQRIKSVLERAKQPFPGAGTVLRGDDTRSHPRALHAALVLDTILYPKMTNRIEALAEAGFDTLHPDAQTQSNYEYERLFRVARDAISDGLAQNADRDELVDVVAGDVMKAAARNDDSEYGEEDWKREPAEEFGKIFVDDIFHGICDGDFYELRRHENHLASGYNAAIRRQLDEFFDEHSE